MTGRASTPRRKAAAQRARQIRSNRLSAKKARAAIGRQSHTINAEGREKCPFCLGKVSSITRVTMGCVHQFHRRCLYRWLKYNSTCPVCRVALQVEGERGEADERVAEEERNAELEEFDDD